MASGLADTIEHTLLRSTATPEQIELLCSEALEHGFYGVCVHPIYVALARDVLSGSSVAVVTVVAFPLGCCVPAVAAKEAELGVRDGAHELDLVIPVGLALAGRLDQVRAAVQTVRDAVPNVTLKAILETGCYAPEQLREVCRYVLEARPDFLKTSTGFGPRGASVQDVQLLAECAGGRARIKASGGIRTANAALSLLAAGASRLGTSNSVAIVTEQAVLPREPAKSGWIEDRRS